MIDCVRRGTLAWIGMVSTIRGEFYRRQSDMLPWNTDRGWLHWWRDDGWGVRGWVWWQRYGGSVAGVCQKGFRSRYRDSSRDLPDRRRCGLR